MKKLYDELIELYCKDNSSDRISLHDAIDSIQEDLKSYHNFSFTDALSSYVTEHFLDKKTKEYLIKKYGNEVNHNLGFEEWERDLMKTSKERKLEKQMMLQESREKFLKYMEEQSRKDKESESAVSSEGNEEQKEDLR